MGSKIYTKAENNREIKPNSPSLCLISVNILALDAADLRSQLIIFHLHFEEEVYKQRYADVHFH